MKLFCITILCILLLASGCSGDGDTIIVSSGESTVPAAPQVLSSDCGNGTVYGYTGVAVNAIGESEPSELTTAVPMTVPGRPVNFKGATSPPILGMNNNANIADQRFKLDNAGCSGQFPIYHKSCDDGVPLLYSSHFQISLRTFRLHFRQQMKGGCDKPDAPMVAI